MWPSLRTRTEMRVDNCTVSGSKLLLSKSKQSVKLLKVDSNPGVNTAFVHKQNKGVESPGNLNIQQEDMKVIPYAHKITRKEEGLH